MINSKHFWFYLMNIGENIAALDPDDRELESKLLEQLDTLQEVYGRSFDPVDDFEAYAAVYFGNSIRRLLAGRQASQEVVNAG